MKEDMHMTIKNFSFKIILNGIGKTAEEAWEDAVEGFMLDPGPTPEPDEYEVEEIEEEE